MVGTGVVFPVALGVTWDIGPEVEVIPRLGMGVTEEGGRVSAKGLVHNPQKRLKPIRNVSGFMPAFPKVVVDWVRKDSPMV